IGVDDGSPDTCDQDRNDKIIIFIIAKIFNSNGINVADNFTNTINHIGVGFGLCSQILMLRIATLHTRSNQSIIRIVFIMIARNT
ncbi:MAG: hypothetical protein K2K70_11125, partial [Lachnospiraceae bacterium]|nr:hypothetical protein [Lachnospiraceae bacterium]